jgi:pimeloyl-ACP methyl ester carboxylesterase
MDGRGAMCFARPGSTFGASTFKASAVPTATPKWTQPLTHTARCVSLRTPPVSLLAHSWGTIVAGRFAGANPNLVERLALFGPIARREGPPGAEQANGPAWRVITVDDQHARFVEDVPPSEPQVLARPHFEDWAARYLDSDKQSRGRDPAGVKIPTGPFLEIARAWQGDLAYDPGLVRAPTAIFRGEWDSLVTDADARWLWDALKRSPVKRDVKIGRGTHLMHLERMRLALWRESVAFLLEDDVAPVPA